MAYNFLESNRDQMYLMPPSIRDWLPEDHLAWFIVEVVEEFDLTPFYHPPSRLPDLKSMMLRNLLKQLPYPLPNLSP